MLSAFCRAGIADFSAELANCAAVGRSSCLKPRTQGAQVRAVATKCDAFLVGRIVQGDAVGDTAFAFDQASQAGCCTTVYSSMIHKN